MLFFLILVLLHRNHHLRHAFFPNLNVINTFTLKKCYPFLYSLQIVNLKDCILLQFMIAIRRDQGRVHCSVTESYSTLCDPIDYSARGFPVFTISLSVLRLMFLESVMPSNHLILCCLSPLALNLSQHQGLFQ